MTVIVWGHLVLFCCLEGRSKVPWVFIKIIATEDPGESGGHTWRVLEANNIYIFNLAFRGQE